MLSSRKYGTPSLQLYKEDFLGYLTLKISQTKLKYIFSPFWHKCTPTCEKVYRTSRNIYRKSSYIYCAASTIISVETKKIKFMSMFCLCPIIAWVEQNESLQQLLRAYFAWCKRELPNAIRIGFKKILAVLFRNKKNCKPLASVLTLKTQASSCLW